MESVASRFLTITVNH